MAWDNAVVTNAGVAMLKDVLTGGVLTLDDTAGGTGTVPAASLMAQTALKEQKQQFTIVSSMNVTNGKKIKIQITNLGLTAGYTLHQIGIWAHVDNGAPVLFAILQDSSGIAVPAESELADFVLSFYAVVNFSNAAAFTMTVDSSALVSMSTLNEALQCKADLGDDRKILESQLPEMDYISTSEKGAASGVAELDSAGKIPESQLPEMNYDEKGSADAALTVANEYTDSSAAQTLAAAKAYADASTSTFVYKCTGKADSTAIAKIINDFFDNGTAMNMKLIITGTMGLAFSKHSSILGTHAMAISSSNSRGAEAFLDFSGCYIPTVSTASRSILCIYGGVNLKIFGLIATSAWQTLLCLGSGTCTFVDCKSSGSEGARIEKSCNNIFVNSTLIGSDYGIRVQSGASGNLSVYTNCKIIGGIYGIYMYSTNTSVVARIIDSKIKGSTQDIYHNVALNVKWHIRGCSFSNSSIYINASNLTVTSTIANAYVAIQAYHNLFSQTIS